jgi:hypothetical protein
MVRFRCAFRDGVEHDAVDVDARQVDGVGLQGTQRHDLFHFDDGHLAGHGHRGVEVARGQAEHQVARDVGLPGLDQRNLGHERAFHHVAVAVELADLLAFGHQRADAGARVEGRDAGAAGAQPLGQRALGRELQLQLAGQVLALELLVLAHVAADHLLDLARVQQLAQAEAVDAGVVAEPR